MVTLQLVYFHFTKNATHSRWHKGTIHEDFQIMVCSHWATPITRPILRLITSTHNSMGIYVATTCYSGSHSYRSWSRSRSRYRCRYRCPSVWTDHKWEGLYLYPPRSGSERNSRSNIPSVMYLISVLSDVQSSNRMLYPTCSNKHNTVPNLQQQTQYCTQPAATNTILYPTCSNKPKTVPNLQQ